MNSTQTQTHIPSPRGIRRAALAVAVPVLAASTVAAPAVLTTQTANASPTMTRSVSHFSGGGVTIKGKRWLQGHGVSVIRSRQCTELASRLYAKKGWGRITNFYGMRSNRTYSKKLKFHRNATGYRPVPGDVLVELGGPYQHVAVVNKVTKKRIYTVEQNATPSARHVYRWKGKHGHKAVGAYGPRHVGGFIHSKRNHFK
ncbi:MAG: CHAP domain-containing protein [Candidatus Nanopelagicales bacterium]